MRAYRTLLLAWDASVRGKWVFAQALALAQAHGAALVLHHVLPGGALLMSDAGLKAEDLRNASRRAPVSSRPVIKGLRRAILQARHAGVVCHSAVERGPGIAAAIVRAARQQRADLVILGSHGTSTLQRRLFGSVATRVIQHSPVSVWVCLGNSGQKPGTPSSKLEQVQRSAQ